MKRKEEIKEAAYNNDRESSKENQQYFIEGAEWADENPSEANIAMYLGKKGWPLSTNGIPIYQEAAKAFKEYYEYKRKQWIDKACEWINHVFIGCNEDIIENFRKVMNQDYDRRENKN